MDLKLVFAACLIGVLLLAGCPQQEAETTPPAESETTPEANETETPPTTEELCGGIRSNYAMPYSEAEQIATAVGSACDELGDLAGKDHYCNANSGTWWIEPGIVKDGCNPACVVSVDDKSAEINWRCTGALPETEPEEELCTKTGTDYSMGLSRAKQLAEASDCGQRGPLKEPYTCNADTGTWWLDSDIQKPGCYPACVVDVETNATETNWRCTGLVPPE